MFHIIFAVSNETPEERSARLNNRASLSYESKPPVVKDFPRNQGHAFVVLSAYDRKNYFSFSPALSEKGRPLKFSNSLRTLSRLLLCQPNEFHGRIHGGRYPLHAYAQFSVTQESYIRAAILAEKIQQNPPTFCVKKENCCVFARKITSAGSIDIRTLAGLKQEILMPIDALRCLWGLSSRIQQRNENTWTGVIANIPTKVVFNEPSLMPPLASSFSGAAAG